MELRQLRYLVELARDPHFTRAAERANVAQPALSRQIRKLEDELGVPLVDRTSRRVALTDAGQQLATRARRILDEVDAARSEISDLRGLVTGRVAVGTSTTPGAIDVAAVLAAFHREYPHVELEVRDALSVDLTAGVLNGDLDLAVVTLAHQRMETVTLGSEPLVLCVSRSHRLAEAGTIALRALRDESFAAFPEGATIRDEVERAAAAEGFMPAVAFELNDVPRMRALVAADLGVAVLPRSQVPPDESSLAVVELQDPGLTHRLLLARRADRAHSPAARAFWTSCIETTSDPATTARR